MISELTIEETTAAESLSFEEYQNYTLDQRLSRIEYQRSYNNEVAIREIVKATLPDGTDIYASISSANDKGRGIYLIADYEEETGNLSLYLDDGTCIAVVFGLIGKDLIEGSTDGFVEKTKESGKCVVWFQPGTKNGKEAFCDISYGMIQVQGNQRMLVEFDRPYGKTEFKPKINRRLI